MESADQFRTSTFPDERKTSDFKGAIDFVSGNVVAGWVARVGSDEKVDVKVKINGIRVGSTVRSGIFRKELQDAGVGDGEYGFEVSVPWTFSFGDTRRIEVVDATNNKVILERIVGVQEAFVGFFEIVERQRVAGWLARWGVDEPVHFDIKINGAVVAMDLVSNRYRADLEDAGAGSGCHSFDISFPQPIYRGADAFIEFIEKKSGVTVMSANGSFGRDLDEPEEESRTTRDSWRANTEELDSVSLPDGSTLHVSLGQDNRHLVIVSEGLPQTIEVWRSGVLFETLALAGPPIHDIDLTVDGKVDAPDDQHIQSRVSYCLLGDGEAVDIALRHEGVSIFDASLKTQSSFAGQVDRLADGALLGWAVDFRSNSPARLDLYVNEILHSTHSAIRRRRDIDELFNGRALSGFEIKFDEALFDESRFRLALRISGTEHELPSKLGAISSDMVATRRRHVWGNAHFRLADMRPVTIVVPIYNAPDEVEACVDSLLRTVPLHSGNFEILLSDDASPDPQVRKVLEKYVGLHGVTIVYQPTNLGYTKNINAGIRAAGNRDVVLLNSDTEVTDRWLEKLQRAAYREPSIGTVTAVSDNAGAFSIPNRNRKNSIPMWLDRASYARLISETSKFIHPPVPTGSGFCLYLKRSMIDAIGLFDEVLFPRGYGEENEFCMRAQNAGWMNIVAEDVLIYHERSASFKETKTELMSVGSEKVEALYPEYPTAVGAAFASNPLMTQLRYDIRKSALRATTRPLPRILFVIGVESGGTPQTNMDLMSSIQGEFHCFLLLCSTATLRLFEICGDRRELVEEIKLSDPVTAILHDSKSYASTIVHLLQAYDIDLVHIRHIGRHGLSLVSSAKRLSIPVIFSLHDFYTVCPNTKLLDGDGNYCAGRCTQGVETDCNVELWPSGSVPPLKHKWIRSWQARLGEVLKSCDVLITTSPTARTVVSDVYDLKGVPFEIIPHGRDFADFMDPVMVLPKAGAPLKVLAPGHLVRSKGSDLIAEIKKLDRDNLIEFHFLGTNVAALHDCGIEHGRYERNEFSKHVEQIRPDVGFVVSIWPETYSHTLTELWSCGIPVVASSLGALGERVRKHGGGWVLEALTPQEGFDLLMALRNDREKILKEQRRVQEWQSGYGQFYNVEAMAQQYVSIYRRTLLQRVQPKACLPRVYVASLNASRNRNSSMPLKHLEAALDSILGEGPRDTKTMSGNWFRIAEELPKPDLLVVQVDEASDIPVELITAWQDANSTTPVILNILSPLAAIVADDTRAAALKSLISRATLVVASGGPLTEEEEATVAGLQESRARENALAKVILPIDATMWTAQQNDMRLDAEVGERLSQWVGPHSRPYVDANFERIDWNGLLASARARQPDRVSIVIPVYNDFNMTNRLLQTIATTGSGDYEIIVVDNGSKPNYSDRLKSLEKVHENVRVVSPGTNLMFAAGCNFGASFSTGEYILFLNNDMEAIDLNWLDSLVEPLKTESTIGISGGKLVYADGTVQHAGIVFGAASKFPYHIYKGQNAGSAKVSKTRRFRAVTGACLALRASDWIKLRGFNPIFVNGSEDVDLCLRMKKVLRRDTIYIPDSVLIHHEGKTPGRGRWNVKNREIFVSIWGDQLRADDLDFYQEDSVTLSGYTTTDGALDQSIRAISPII